MTLILAIPAHDGIVVASDGQITSGMIRTTGQKIQRLNDHCVWAASGELALIQRVEERITQLPPNAFFPSLRDQIGQIVKACVTELLQLDFRAPFLPQDPNLLLQLHPGDFVFTESSPNPYILHITSYGTPELIKDRAFASGSGEPFAYALLHKYHRKNLDSERASVLAYKVIEEAIEVGAYGLGPPIDIWHISPQTLKQLGGSEIAAIADTVRTLREAEVSLLVRKES